MERPVIEVKGYPERVKTQTGAKKTVDAFVDGDIEAADLRVTVHDFPSRLRGS